MINKIRVEVFGVRDQAAGGGCSCSGDCGPTKTMGDLYREVESHLKNSTVNNQIDMTFIDVFHDELDEYKYVIDAMNKGFGLPLTAVNGELKFFGGMSGEMIVDLIEKSA